MTDLRGGYTQTQLHDAFNLVQNVEDWKMPIDAIVPREQVDKDLVSFAVMYFTGAYPIIEEAAIPSFYRIRADGYYMTIGA